MKKYLKMALLSVVTLFLLTGCGTEKKYPEAKSINVIVPKAPGGGTDLSTRAVIQFMKENLAGANFTPINKPDGGGITGMVETAKSKADGYTLGVVTVELAMFPHQGKTTLTYEDFKPVAATIAAPATLIVPANSPYNTVEEFVAHAQKNPKEVKMGNSGMGAIWHIATLTFEKEYNVELKHIPYPNGSADIAAALAGGHIDATIADPSSYKSLYEAGQVKMLASMADSRSKLYPNVPTFKELGKDLTIRAWAVLVAPKNTPDDVVKQLRDAMTKTSTSTAYQEYLMKQGIDPVVIVGEEAFNMMKEDHNMYKEMLKEAIK